VLCNISRAILGFFMGISWLGGWDLHGNARSESFFFKNDLLGEYTVIYLPSRLVVLAKLKAFHLFYQRPPFHYKHWVEWGAWLWRYRRREMGEWTLNENADTLFSLMSYSSWFFSIGHLKDHVKNCKVIFGPTLHSLLGPCFYAFSVATSLISAPLF
jgi:hypothetical protein